MNRYYMALIFLVLAATGEARNTASLAVGAFYINGDYGADDDTTMHYVPVTVAYRTGGLKLSATTAWLALDGRPGDTSGIIDGNGALPASGEAEGMGDSMLKASYDYSSESRRLMLRPLVKIKIPTADEDRGLGTGATDYTVQLEAFYFIGGWWPFVSAGYRWRGDGSYNADRGFALRYPIELENGAIFGAGFFKPISASTSLTASYEHREPSILHVAATQELLLTFQKRFDANWSTSFSAGTGFSARSADTIAGTQLEYRF